MTEVQEEKKFGSHVGMKPTTYIDLNAELILPGEDGKIQFDKEKEAARQYHLQHINPNTVFFHNLKEKIHYLIENGYYDGELFDMYEWRFVKKLYTKTYSYKYRFQSFIGALKFYNQYGLKTYDGQRYLERLEDRVAIVALYLAQGDEEMAMRYVDEIISGRMQPATPTFTNAGKAFGGLPISCYLLDVQDNLKSINRVIGDSKELSKMGGGVGINITNIRSDKDPIQNVADAASGVIPFMKELENSFSWINQLGTRPGSGAVYISVHHPNVMNVLDTKRENADEKIRIKTLSIGLVITDILFEAARRGDDIYQFSPYDVQKVYGKPMSEISIKNNYDDMIEDPRIRKYKVNARKLFQVIAELQFESGYPYLMFEDRVNHMNNTPNINRIMMSNLCVTGDTEILTSNGYRRAYELWETQEDFDVIVDERARTMSLDNKGTSVQKSTKMFKTAENADIFKLTTLEGYEIRATAWHKMYVDRDGELVKIPLAEVIPGDRVLVQGGKSASLGSVHKPDEAYLAGVIASDGTFGATRNGEYSARIDLYGEKSQFKDSILGATHRVLRGRDELLRKHNSTLEPKFVYSEYSDRYSMTSRPLTLVLSELGFTKESKLSVPNFVKCGDEDTMKSYLNGLWQMDGCITGNEKIGSISIELTSINRDFLRGIQNLLLELGVYTRIYTSSKGGEELMPNEKGGSSLYKRSPSWSLRATDRRSREELHDIVTWKDSSEEYWRIRNEGIKSEKYYNTHKYRATVSSIEFDGIEDVYDPTVENGHSVIYNGLVTGQCSEILQPQTPSTFHKNGYFDEVGTDISCNLASLNIHKMMENGENFGDSIDTAVRALTSVSDVSDISQCPTVEKGNNRSHAIGLGAMNLHGFLGFEKIHYGSFESLDFVNMYFSTVLFHAVKASHAIAKERGEAFYGFEGSKFSNGEFFAPFINARFSIKDEDKGGHDLFVKTKRVKELFDKYNFTPPTRKDWEQLQKDVERDGIYNRNLIAIAPTGSISMVNGSTMSIHPVAAPIVTRKEGKIGRVYWASPGLTQDNAEYFSTAFDIGSTAVIEVYNTIAPYVDQGASLTLFFKDTATTRDLNRAYKLAWGGSKTFHGRDTEDSESTWNMARRQNLGAVSKTIYYSRISQEAIDGTQVDNINDVLCPSCQV